MSVDSADAPPPPPPPPPPSDYSLADQPVTDEGQAAPESTPAAGMDAAATGADAAAADGPEALAGSDELAPADVPVVDEGQAPPDLATATDPDVGSSGDLPGESGPDDGSPQQAQDRRSWEPTGDSSDLPASMQEDLGQLGQDLRSDVDPDAWEGADQDARAEMLSDANNTIRETYGLPPGEVNYSSELPDGTTGQYDPDTGDVTLNSSLLEDQNPDEAINTLSHENFHDYQQQAIDGEATDPYAESRVDAWTEGQANYDSEDFTAYMENPLEADAFAAERAVFDGYRRK
jgi:hypothetical protein